MTQQVRAFFRWLPTSLLMLTTVAFNPVAQAQDTPAESGKQSKSIWKLQNTPNNNFANILESLSADSENDLWAVGDFVSLKFDGKKWTLVPLAFPGGEASMDGIAVVSSTDVWAVGSTLQNGTHLISVIEHFDGQRWSIVTSPQFSSGSQLFKIAALSATDIFAVGATNSDAQKGTPLVEHFDGNSWTVVKTPKLPKGQTGILNGISALSHNDLWVVGAGRVQGTAGPPIVWHFDGSQFTPVPFPVADASIGGITQITSNDAWIVGSNGTALTVHWDGTAWTEVPNPGGGAGTVTGLSQAAAVSSTDIWASGDLTFAGGGFFNFAEHWDGTSWTVSPIPTSEQEFDELNAALAFPNGHVYLAGTRIGPCNQQTCGVFDSVVFRTTKGK